MFANITSLHWLCSIEFIYFNNYIKKNYDLQNEKKELINNILDDKSLKNNHIFDLSEDEILNLFK